MRTQKLYEPCVFKKPDLGSAQRKRPTAVPEQLNSVLSKKYHNDNLPITLPLKVE